MTSALIIPTWPAPASIVGFTTTRAVGNLATHVEDSLAQVEANRAALYAAQHLPQAPYWLNQTHSARVVTLDAQTTAVVPDADGSYTRLANTVCAVLTADCLPLLLCSSSGEEICALHAGWRGLLGDIIARGVEQFSCAREDILVWLGPAIGPQVFELSQTEYDLFVQAHAGNAAAFSASTRDGHYLLDIYALARHYLQRLGITAVYGGEYCTYSSPDRFYSYRRENKTGRMATLIWRKS